LSSLVEIANSALDLVGQQQILGLEDNTTAARKANLHIYDAIREVLAIGKWKSAQGQASLPRLAAAPTFGWLYAYQLPNDYLAMVSVNDNDPGDVQQDLWDIQGRTLLTDETAVDLTYIKDLTAAGNDINAASQWLTECFKLKLATKLAWVFQQSRTLRESLLQEYAIKLKQAMGRDSRESRKPLVNQLSESNWLRNRSASTNG
jgi:hypothetical protein